jgi:hypothetical protein
MDLGDERAGRVKHGQAAFLGILFDRTGDAVRAENGDSAGRHFVQFVDENGAFGAQGVDHMLVMDNFVPHIDRRRMAFQSPFNDVDGTSDACAETTRIGENDIERPRRTSPGFTMLQCAFPLT